MRIELPLKGGKTKVIEDYRPTIGSLYLMRKAGCKILKAMADRSAFDMLDTVEALIVLMEAEGISRADIRDNDLKYYQVYNNIFMDIMDEMNYTDAETGSKDGNAPGEL